ncbi:MAG: hypothetical protein APF81_24155 [Desulfosporosinus sp. BRH_c37]|nr:MAG: hypothetical protein APF81_24155 [Desulfosporosinus sp. BRH_c37]
MVWPKRKIQLVASSAAPGIEGVRAVFNGIQLEFSEAEDLREGIMGNWWEKQFDQKTTIEESGPTTDVVYWSEGTEHDIWRGKALAEGLNQQSVESFIHNILEDEVILRVSEPTVFINGRPLLGHVLQEAGFEPTILWPTRDGKWQCERKQGIHWVIPESWLVSVGEVRCAMCEARTSDYGPRAATWVVRENRLDFYQTQEAREFVGQIPRWPEPMEEQVAAETIARCIDLGVSWLDIRLALSSIWENIIMTDNLRWNINDIGWNAWACGEEIPSAPIDHLEDWWAR